MMIEFVLGSISKLAISDDGGDAMMIMTAFLASSSFYNPR
jgi:hypothetical protein